MFRVVLDTNVIISALNFGGKPAAVLDLARKNIVHNITSPYILKEAENVLRTKFCWDSKRVKRAIVLLAVASELVKPKGRLRVISDVADNRILECAVTGKADFIISGDHHLTDLETFQKIKIVSPATFLNLIVS